MIFPLKPVTPIPLLTMGGFAGTQAVVLAISILYVTIPIWLAVTAKPLGDKSYRWGTYVGVHCGLIAIIGFGSGFLGRGPGMSVGVLFGALFAATCAGVLLRRRFGVVLFLGTTALFEIGGLLVVMSRQTEIASVIESIAAVIWLISNFVYFETRWTGMGPNHSKISAEVSGEAS